MVRWPQTDPSPCVFGCSLFAQNKRLSPDSAVNIKPMSALSRTLQMTSLLLYFWGQQKIPFFGSQRMQMGLGFCCYSKKVSLGRRVFAMEEFAFKLPPLATRLLSLFSSHTLSLSLFSLLLSLSFPPPLSFSPSSLSLHS